MKRQIIILKLALIAAVALVLFFATMIAFKLFSGATLRMGISATLFAISLTLGSLLLILIAFWLNRLLNIIQNQQVFSKLALPTVRHIKITIFLIGIDLIGILPMVYQNVQAEDAPGLMLIGFGIVCLPFAVGIFAAILEQLLIKAITMKDENDLTV
ncbi:DUF2975 domain-containing protein [Lapidilactobacillus bayanensis]|uniref:DUF2975 domain-containing protein n=1 Tax=Lapidilactobacillus bayanensis TaxID=2485998 RepID=UPI000F7861F6|nr:DUF2975 domain-containing protein [Lapidilactobacillus bayanensis]